LDCPPGWIVIPLEKFSDCRDFTYDEYCDCIDAHLYFQKHGNYGKPGTKSFKVSDQFRSIRAWDLFLIARLKIFADVNLGKIDALHTPEHYLTELNAKELYYMPTPVIEPISHKK
jgi:hypothetical protein